MDNFETWTHNSEKLLSPTTYALFMDSLKCYKAEVFRAAYLLAYQGMMWQLREKFKQGKHSNEFSEKEWTAKLESLDLNKPWDFNMFDIISQKARIENGKMIKPPCLKMSDDVRAKFDYWRILRNECAHQKESIFGNAHVLVFYTFIQQNLLLISVEGSTDNLLEEFSRFFDPYYTSPREDIQPLIDKIPRLIAADDYVNFLVKLSEIVNDRSTITFSQVLKKIIDVSSEQRKKITYNFIHSEEWFEYCFLSQYPDAILQLYIEPHDIRKFWKKGHLAHYRNCLSILRFLLEAGAIDDNDKQECFEILLRKLFSQNTRIESIDIVTQSFFENQGLMNVIYKNYYNSKYTCKNAWNLISSSTFLSLLDILPWNNHFVEVTIDILNMTYYPYSLCDIIKEKFPIFNSLAHKYGITIPPEVLNKIH